MRNWSRLLLFPVLLCLTAAADAATRSKKDRDDERSRESVTYSGIGLARVSTDFENLDDAVNLNLTLGFRIPTLDVLGAEIEFGTTIIPGENSGAGGSGTNCGGLLQPPCPGNTADNDELQMNNIAIYGVFRSPGRLYGMGKIGYRYINASIEELMADDRSGAAYGGGVGWRWGERLSGIELYYTRYSEEIDYVGFALNYGFGDR